MASAAKPKAPEKPWMVYRKSDGSRDKLYEPGWGGELTDKEIERLQQALMNDDQLSYWWGWRPGMKRRAASAVERVAYFGSSESRSHNVKLVREAGRRRPELAEGRLQGGNEGGDSCVTKLVGPSPPRRGRRPIRSWESTMLNLAKEGWGLRAIAERLQGEGVDISYRTVGRRIHELRGQLSLPL